MKKEVRELIYNKYNKHCAYCGKKIEYKDMQVDHMQPKFLADRGYLPIEDIDKYENLMPACRRCNTYKRANSLETFRKWIAEIPNKLAKEFITKVGIDYGLVEFHPKSIKFFFEKWDENSKVARSPKIDCVVDDTNTENFYYYCPTCNELIGCSKGVDFIKYTNDTNKCKNCGRLIDWNLQ